MRVNKLPYCFILGLLLLALASCQQSIPCTCEAVKESWKNHKEGLVKQETIGEYTVEVALTTGGVQGCNFLHDTSLVKGDEESILLLWKVRTLLKSERPATDAFPFGNEGYYFEEHRHGLEIKTDDVFRYPSTYAYDYAGKARHDQISYSFGLSLPKDSISAIKNLMVSIEDKNLQLGILNFNFKVDQLTQIIDCKFPSHESF